MHKLGFYLQVSHDQDGLFEAVRRARPPVMLIHTDGLNQDLLQLNRRASGPDAFVIGRLFKPNHEQTPMLTDGDAAQNGRRYADEILQHDLGLAKKQGANGRRLIDAWMTLNEVIPGPASGPFQADPGQFEERLVKYDAFQVAFRQRLQEEGIEAVAFNFAAGNFSEPQHYLKYFQDTLESYIYLGFHEYGWPHLDPDHMDAEHGDAQSGAGLYRRCMEGIRAQHGDRHRVIITEAGLTREYKFPNDPREPEDAQLGDLGWLNHKETLSEDFFWSSLRWYNDFIGQDDYVLGCCLYQVGHSARFRSHRHLGLDNNGHRLAIVDRIAQLASAPATPQAAPLGLGAGAPVRQIACGINIDPKNPNGRPAAQQLDDLGAAWVRLVFKNNDDGELAHDLAFYDDIVNELHDANINILMILNNESCPGRPARRTFPSIEAWQQPTVWQAYIDKFAARCGAVAQHFGDRVAAYQVWNEPDHPAPPLDQEGYDPTLFPVIYGPMLRACHSTIKAATPNATVVTAGMMSGDPTYVQKVMAATGGILHADALGVHPYGQRPAHDWPPPDGPDRPWGFGDLGALLQRYVDVAHKLLWITEIGTRDLRYQGKFPGRAFEVINSTMAQEVPKVFWFCWSDGMVQDMGLVRGDQVHNTSYASFQTFAKQPAVAPLGAPLAAPAPMAIGAAVVERLSDHWSTRQGQAVRYIIVHSSDSPVGVPATATLDYLIHNDRQVSAHELVLPGDRVYRLVPDDRAAHHCESDSVRFPDGTPSHLANEITWGIEAYQVKGMDVGRQVLKKTVQRVAAACQRFGLNANHVLGHREIDPARRRDPVGVDMNTLRAMVQQQLDAR